MLAQLPIWLIAIAGFPWWVRRMLAALRDLDRYRDERRGRRARGAAPASGRSRLAPPAGRPRRD